MKFNIFKNKKKESKKEEHIIPSDNLYFSLIGNIDAEIISEDLYINRGEYPTHYTVVRKLETPDTYVDLFEEKEYSFRDENSDDTILKMYLFNPSEEYTTLEYLQDILDAYETVLDDNKIKPGDNKAYARTRKID